jgi:hypothetical protein
MAWAGRHRLLRFAYHAVPSNLGALVAFHHYVTGLWRRTLRRRSQKDRANWSDMTRLVSQWLPQPRIQHPCLINASPSNTQGGSRMRESRTYGFVPGARSDMRPYRDTHDQEHEPAFPA